jgi:predicted secreted protein
MSIPAPRRIAALVLLLVPLVLTGPARADDERASAPPILTVTASAETQIANDRMQALLRAEAESDDPGQAASQVNARMAHALTRARQASGIEVSTGGYSSYQVGDKDHLRWRVTQSMTLQGKDFAALTRLASALQSDDGLLLSGLAFSVSPAARRATENALFGQAIRAWQARAELAAQAFGKQAWRPGRVNIQTEDQGRPQPMLRAQTFGAAASSPVSVEGGSSDLAVVVCGEVILAPPAR